MSYSTKSLNVLAVTLMLLMSPAAKAVVSFSSMPGGPFVAFSDRSGVIGREDYVSTSIHGRLIEFGFVGGVSSDDSSGGEIELRFYTTGGTTIFSSTTLTLANDGRFRYNSLPLTLDIPTSGELEIFIDTTSAANIGRNVVGQWFAGDNTTINVGSSPGNPAPLVLPDNGTVPRVHNFSLTVAVPEPATTALLGLGGLALLLRRRR